MQPSRQPAALPCGSDVHERSRKGAIRKEKQSIRDVLRSYFYCILYLLCCYILLHNYIIYIGF